ncbi:hypothetical protein [Flavobacterium sp. GT3R68]|uniref:hypothetical protein n=1 Tax=Flavobacterium sp. GT3R68 TaxID=2594437 RepID=UPI000F89A9CB|nr:hypothetical protein [Flavobacterium sp. GT3R68]RTY89102.1 hypothetical protein EKL32_24070 [Flavobacterium sp. GSN2]TRW90100.1 hypothetical protein FNW07_11620 [Flavobacterium sp. GT3R68]
MQHLNLESQHVNGRFSTELAIGSFIIGTVFFILHQVYPNADSVFMMGFMYVATAILLNAIMLIHLVYHFLLCPNQSEYIAIKMMILLSNIPIAAMYYHIIFS